MKSLLARLRDQLRRLVNRRRGSVAIIFALASLPIIGLIGASIDYSRANAAKADLQSALDATALMVSKSAATMTSSELQNAAKSYFDALFKNSDVNTTTITASYSPESSTVTINGTSSINADFVGVLGPAFSKLPISASTSVTWGSSKLRVALALDNTGSMASSNKMSALKTAANNLLTQLKSAAQTNGDVYVSIVPFAKDVNVGQGYYNATWIDFRDHGSWDGWDSNNGSCSQRRYDTKEECEDHNRTWTPDNHNTWNGCVTDRDQDYDVVATTPASNNQSTLVPAEQYQDCPVALMPLSYDWIALKNKINSMQPEGNTNITIGLVWAWQTLTTGAPFAAPAEESGYKYQKVIILLTDGENTQNRFTSNRLSIDARTKKACANAKAAGITIYTVLVMEGTQSLLQTCASDSNKYFYLTSATQLVTTFQQIGTDLSNLHVSK